MAFDPFTAVAVVETAANAVTAVSDAAGEVAGASQAFGELYGEIDSDASVSAQGQRLVQKIHDTEELAREAGYSYDEVAALGNQDDIKNLTTLMQKMTRAIRAGKNVARLLTKLDKKAQISQVESAQIEREQLAIQSQLLQKAIEESLDRKKEELEKIVARKKYLEAKEREIKERGGMRWGRIGVYSFPDLRPSIKVALDISKSLRPYFLSLMLLAFLLRLVYLQFRVSSSGNYGTLIRDAFLCAFWLCVFPSVVQLIAETSLGLAAKIAGPQEMSAMGHLPPAPDTKSMLNLSNLFSWIYAMVKVFLFNATDFLFNFGTAFLVIIFPLIIFVSTLLGFSIGIGTFLSILLSLALWPFFWNITGQLATVLWSRYELLTADGLASLFFGIAQFLVPWIAHQFLHGHSLMTAASGLITQPARAAVAQVPTAPAHAYGIYRGMRGENSGGSTLGRMVGSAAGYVPVQVAQRSFAAMRQAQGSLKNAAPQMVASPFRMARNVVFGSSFKTPVQPEKQFSGPITWGEHWPSAQKSQIESIRSGGNNL